MLLPPLCNHQTSIASKTIPSFCYFPSPLPKTLPLQNPNKVRPKLLLLCASISGEVETQTLPQSAIKRIADKLRSLGYGGDENKEESTETRSSNPGDGSPGEIFIPLPRQLPKYRVGHTIDPSWSTPENPVPEPGRGRAIQRFHKLRRQVFKEKKEKGEEGRGKVPTLAELTLPKEELRRLRATGIGLKKKLKIGKAGITEGIVNGIHERWRHSELVRIMCHDICSLNMKRTHDLLERKTGGLVIWRSGSNIILYRGPNYKYPYFLSHNNLTNETSSGTSPSSSIDCTLLVREESGSFDTDDINSGVAHSLEKMAHQPLVKGVGSPERVRFQLPGEAQLAEEADCLLDGLGPRFTDWWGYDPLPVDADLLPAIVPGYRKPFRLLPYGVKPKLTNDEMTILKRLGRPLPCHFVLGRNRKLQGLAASMVRLWEKCEIAKIAVKRGVQNTNSELMAEELKWLTGGTLLSRDKEFIVFYRGKDFLPSAVSSAIEERRKCGTDTEERRTHISSAVTMQDYELGISECRSGDECHDIKDQESDLVSEQRTPISTEATTKRTCNKLQMALEKKARAEKLLAELEKEETLQEAEIDKEGITEEERYMLRKVGLRMNPFLLLGKRGVFDGTVENMHLHWKYRELVKVICGARSIEEVHAIAQTLEAESGGILVAVERVSKGYAIIVYRGKNYKRPASLRPQTLLSKREALKRSVEAQRHESLKLHVLKLSRNIDYLKLRLAKDKETNSTRREKGSNFQSARERFVADSSQFKSTDSLDASQGGPGTSQKDLLGGYSLSCQDKENGFRINESELVSKSELNKSNVLTSMNGQVGHAEPATCPNDSGEAVTPSVESRESRKELPVQSTAENTSTGVPFRTARLSNRERLLLRKQALKMKKRPVLAVGRSNVVTGVAKAIKAHFKKHPLAIVNVKGRAEGTSVQEVVFKLEQATGAVLVSQEPSKVILYRGWRAEEETIGLTEAGKNTQDARKTASGREGGVGPVISAELMSAIRLECGLNNSTQKEVEA
ncbi:CRM-domain containing factor CFM2, chloroplastic isoform X2 [Diospyros lotus]|uniref:CRM-domain containing factor CFM2, chloroplastic isoform X2 n=1 Tax=Diospyros lotus TaxID=55363 RepID=UPI00225793D4|nr:CRM-domain containing factor CFM2, chloroplastic isoform X2 [Diospyros lotus]